MRIHLGAAILEQAADILKSGACCLGIMRRNSARGCKQALSDSIRIGMEDKRGKNIAKNHSTEDETDSTNHKDSSRAPRRKSLCGLRHSSAGADCAFMSTHRGSGLAIAKGSIAAFYAEAW